MYKNLSPKAVATELLLGRLWFSPEGPSCHTPETISAKVLAVQELSDITYTIPHYGPQAIGHAFGPLGLDRILQFGSKLRDALDRYSKVVLSYPPDDIEIHSNVAVVVGAYLVLWCGWDSAKVDNAIGLAISKCKFTCAWAMSEASQSERVLCVRDCWKGLQKAVELKWLDPAIFEDPGTLAKYVKDYQSMVYQFDASWIVPGLLLVCADPVSTGLDPNPVTFTRLFPTLCSDDESDLPDLSFSPQVSPPTPLIEAETPHSVATVCKLYETEGDEEEFGKASDFTTFLKELGTTLIVRTNHTMEPGLDRSYIAEDFVTRGIDHLDMPFVDVRGSVPGGPELKILLERCKPYLDGSKGAIAIHCKGGFGRSICCLAKLASITYDIPGSALLGWIRIARPGAVNTTSQELFISSLNRSMDTDKDVEDMSGKCPCSRPCSVQ